MATLTFKRRPAAQIEEGAVIHLCDSLGLYRIRTAAKSGDGTCTFRARPVGVQSGRPSVTIVRNPADKLPVAVLR